MDSLEHLVQEHHFQKNFLGLEITEKELSEHFDKMKDASKKLYKVDIDLICDAYTGEYFSLEKIKALGINMIKISRQIVSNIDKDEAIYNELLSLINSAYERDIKVCLVGVEMSINIDSLLKNILIFQCKVTIYINQWILKIYSECLGKQISTNEKRINRTNSIGAFIF